MLNPSKSEFLWCIVPRWILLIDRYLYSEMVQLTYHLLISRIRKVGALFNVAAVDERSRQQTRPIVLLPVVPDRVNPFVTPCLLWPRLNSGNSFIISWVDYCNSILTGVPKYQLDRKQVVLNVAGDAGFRLQSIWSHHTTLKWPAVLATGSTAHWFQAMFDGITSAARSLAPGYISDLY